MISIAITGHRPQKLYGYDIATPQWTLLRAAMRSFLCEGLAVQPEGLHCLSGMALGVDQLFALVVLELKDAGYPLTLSAVCPCRGLERCWKDASIWHSIMEKADTVTYVHDGPFTPPCFEQRDQYLLAHCNVLLAAYAGIAGGTARCVSAAVSQGKPVCHLLNGMTVTVPHFP